jgi:hypothetical protein
MIKKFLPERKMPRKIGWQELFESERGSVFLSVDPGVLGSTILISHLVSMTEKVR